MSLSNMMRVRHQVRDPYCEIGRGRIEHVSHHVVLQRLRPGGEIVGISTVLRLYPKEPMIYILLLEVFMPWDGEPTCDKRKLNPVSKCIDEVDHFPLPLWW
jgi:hypothetical protein